MVEGAQVDYDFSKGQQVWTNALRDERSTLWNGYKTLRGVELNAQLRAQPGVLPPTARRLVDFIKMEPAIKEDAAFYRGARFPKSLDLKPGMVLQDHGFTSLSTEKDFPQDIASNPWWNDKGTYIQQGSSAHGEYLNSTDGYLFRVIVPGGTQMGEANDTERVLPPGARMEILSVSSPRSGPSLNDYPEERVRDVTARVI